MRGVDLNVFDFDYDLTWAALFLDAEERVLGRYGGRDAASPDTFLSLEGLRHALLAALAAHRRAPAGAPPARPARRVEEYPAAARLTERACVHCHQVYDFRREARQDAGLWSRDEVWVHPLPENVGLTLDMGRNDRVRAVAADSPAAHAGLRAGDVLRELGGYRIASVADVQYALHGAPAAGRVSATWTRGGQEFRSELMLTAGWRMTDLSWRPSLRGVGPQPSVFGEDLTPEEKRALGLPASRLAFRQENFVPKQARQAGIRQNDIILGVDGKRLEMTARQFQVYVRLNYNVGDRVIWNLLREGRRLDVPMTLPGRNPF